MAALLAFSRCLVLLVCALFLVQLCQARNAFDGTLDQQSMARTLENAPEGMFQKVGDRYLYQGDMLLTAQQAVDVLQRGLAIGVKLWPRDENGLLGVYYRVSSDPDLQGGYVQKAMNTIVSRTCLRTMELLGASGPTEFPYLSFIKSDDPNTCQSPLGLSVAKGPQETMVSSNCGESVTIHEVLHGFGFGHEQSRSDRDDYVAVYMENVDPKLSFNLEKGENELFGIPYDYYSLMQYKAVSFSINGKFTMRSKNPLFQTVMGEAPAMSFMDAKLFNIAYKCTDEWKAECKGDPCKNGGYIFKGCSCMCPPGTSGANCETVDMAYNDAILKKYFPENVKITSPGNIRSTTKTTGVNTHSKIIQAPKCKKVVLTFKYFEVSMEPDSNNACTWEYMAIISGKDDKGQYFCGSDIKPGTKFESKESEMEVHFYHWGHTKKGYSADITFEPLPNCS